jgi:Holliday junction resolvasome RuvABC ATP-dependent DNA helicase subunit
MMRLGGVREHLGASPVHGILRSLPALQMPAVRQLLERNWAPEGVERPQTPLDPETISLIIRIASGNFRLLNRLLTQIQRILEINTLKEITKAVVAAARESLVIVQA